MLSKKQKGHYIMLKFLNNYSTSLTNLEDLFTAVFVIVDDMYQKYAPVQVKKRKNVSKSRISDPEIIAIALTGEMLGVNSENAWYSFVKKNYLYLFPSLCSRSRFHRRRNCLHQTSNCIMAGLAHECEIELCENYIVDSFPLPVCKFGRARYCKSFRTEDAAYGKCPSKKETYFGYKVHVLTTVDGFISNYVIGKAAEDDREGLYCLTESISGITIIGDKGYTGEFLRDRMAERRITLIAMQPSNYKKQWSARFRQLIFKLRRKIETVFSQLSEQMHSERVLAKSFWGLCTRMSDKMLAYNLSMVLNALVSGVISSHAIKSVAF